MSASQPLVWKNHASDHSSYLSQIVFAHILAANVKLGEWKLYERRLTCTDGQTQLRQVENDVVHDRLYAQNNVECLLQVNAGSCRLNAFCLHFCMYEQWRRQDFLVAGAQGGHKIF